MIIPNELRVGSWIMDAHPYDDIFQVRWSHIASIIENGSDYRPISLTPEWLIKLGFKKQSDGFWFLSGGYYVIEGKDGWHLSIGGGLLSKVVIKSIHQLQNYYFVHQNKELELKNN